MLTNYDAPKIKFCKYILVTLSNYDAHKTVIDQHTHTLIMLTNYDAHNIVMYTYTLIMPTKNKYKCTLVMLIKS